MQKARLIRDTIIKILKITEDFKEITAIDINGFNYAGADIIIPNRKGKYDAYRINIVSYNP